MKGRRRLTLPRLPRRWRIVRNAAATLLLLGALAAALDFPVLTQYGTFRKLEEQYLLAPRPAGIPAGRPGLRRGLPHPGGELDCGGHGGGV